MTRRIPRWFGFNPPFVGGPQGVMSRQEELRLVKNDVLQLLLTIPGERIHRPEFGTPIRTDVFEQNDSITSDQLLIAIRSQLSLEEPRLTDVEVQITERRDSYQLDIVITAKLTQDPNVDFELETTVSFQSQTVSPQTIVSGSGITSQNVGTLSGR